MNQNYNVKEIQKEILGVLDEVVEICDKHNIEYFLICGSVLGAIRHKGFIPWDDDLDIGMTRDNYDKFKSVVTKELSSSLFFQDFESEPNSPFYFAKVRKNDTIFLENYVKDIDMHHGVYIDIFQYDNVPDSNFKAKIQSYRVKLWTNLFISKTLKGSSIPQTTLVGRLKVFIRSIFNFLLKPVSKNYLFNKMDRIKKMYNNEITKSMNYIGEDSMIIDFVDIENLITVEFNERNYKCHDNPKKYLEILYGDYMTFPPEEDRVGHRPIKVEL